MSKTPAVIIGIITFIGLAFVLPGLFIAASGEVLGYELTVMNGIVLWITFLIVLLFTVSILRELKR